MIEGSVVRKGEEVAGELSDASVRTFENFLPRKLSLTERVLRRLLEGLKVHSGQRVLFGPS